MWQVIHLADAFPRAGDDLVEPIGSGVIFLLDHEADGRPNLLHRLEKDFRGLWRDVALSMHRPHIFDVPRGGVASVEVVLLVLGVEDLHQLAPTVVELVVAQVAIVFLALHERVLVFPPPGLAGHQASATSPRGLAFADVPRALVAQQLAGRPDLPGPFVGERRRQQVAVLNLLRLRSEERRVGKECRL